MQNQTSPGNCSYRTVTLTLTPHQKALENLVSKFGHNELEALLKSVGVKRVCGGWADMHGQCQRLIMSDQISEAQIEAIREKFNLKNPDTQADNTENDELNGPQLLSYPVKWQSSPFHSISELIVPTLLIPNTRSSARHERAHLQTTLAFQFTDYDQFAAFFCGRAVIHLRFCGVKQQGYDSVPNEETVDRFPSGLKVQVNGMKMGIFKTLEGHATPVEEVTEPLNYAVTVHVVKLLTALEVFRKFNAKETRPLQATKDMIKALTFKDTTMEEEDVCSPNEIRVSLICPIGQQKMEVPCRASTCSHVQCFDMKNFLAIHERRRPLTFRCPVCNSPIKCESLKTDEYFLEVLSKVPSEDGNIVGLHADGTWSLVDADQNGNRARQSRKRKRNESREEASPTPISEMLDSDDSDESDNEDLPPIPTSTAEVEISSSESEHDEETYNEAEVFEASSEEVEISSSESEHDEETNNEAEVFQANSEEVEISSSESELDEETNNEAEVFQANSEEVEISSSESELDEDTNNEAEVFQANSEEVEISSSESEHDEETNNEAEVFQANSEEVEISSSESEHDEESNNEAEVFHANSDEVELVDLCSSDDDETEVVEIESSALYELEVVEVDDIRSTSLPPVDVKQPDVTFANPYAD